MRQTIGRAASAAGVGVETVRFYERRGLIAQPPTPADGGPREYAAAAVARIRFIRKAQELGFSLGEIDELLSLRTAPGTDCADVRARAVVKRDEVAAKITELAAIRSALEDLIDRCPGSGDVAGCTILDLLDQAAEQKNVHGDKG